MQCQMENDNIFYSTSYKTLCVVHLKSHSFYSILTYTYVGTVSQYLFISDIYYKIPMLYSLFYKYKFNFTAENYKK